MCLWKKICGDRGKRKCWRKRGLGVKVRRYGWEQETRVNHIRTPPKYPLNFYYICYHSRFIWTRYDIITPEGVV